jgi:hypothetical protein
VGLSGGVGRRSVYTAGNNFLVKQYTEGMMQEMHNIGEITFINNSGYLITKKNLGGFVDLVLSFAEAYICVTVLNRINIFFNLFQENFLKRCCIDILFSYSLVHFHVTGRSSNGYL